MHDGTLKLEFVEGVCVAAWVNAGLDAFYERLFRSARRGIWRYPVSVDKGISALLFGCFWLEALSNSLLKSALDHMPLNPAATGGLWKALRKSRLIEKLDAIAGFADERSRRELNKLRKDIAKVVELRNRMVHFKDEDTKIARGLSLSTVEDVTTFFSEVPDPPLLRELKGRRARRHAIAIAATARWLSAAYECHLRELKRSEKLLPPPRR